MYTYTRTWLTASHNTGRATCGGVCSVYLPTPPVASLCCFQGEERGDTHTLTHTDTHRHGTSIQYMRPTTVHMYGKANMHLFWWSKQRMI